MEEKKKKKKAWLFILLCVAALIGLLIINSNTKNKTEQSKTYIQRSEFTGLTEDVEIEEYTLLGDTFFMWSSGFTIASEYKSAEAYINDKGYLSKWSYKTEMLGFEINESQIPKNEAFDITIAFFDDNNANVENIVIKGVCYTDGNIDRVKNQELVKRIIYNYKNTFYLGDLEEFVNLEKLKIWGTSGDAFRGQIDSLAHLKNLRYLDIYAADAIGGDFSSLSGLENLEYLYIRRHLDRINVSPEDVACFKNLKHLELYNYDSYVQGDLSPLANLTNLEHFELGLSGDSREPFECIAKIENLKELAIHTQTGIRDSDCLNPLANMENLESLTISGRYGAPCDLAVVSPLTNIKELMFYTNEGISGDLTDISDLTNLEQLYVSLDNVHGDLQDISNLTNLQTLTLRNCENLTGDIHALQDMEHLTSLDIYNFHQLTSNSSWDNMFENLRHLDFHSCDNFALDIAEAAALPELIDFVCYGCPNVQGDIACFTDTENIECLIIYWSDDIYGDYKVLADHETLRHVVIKYLNDGIGRQRNIEQADPLGVYELWEKYD